MKDEIENKNKTIHIIEKWTIIGIILFILVQAVAIKIVDMYLPKEQRLSKEQYDKYNEDYMGHWYCGTFFINMTVKENFDSLETYKIMNEEYNNDSIRKVCFISGSVCFFVCAIFIVIAEFKERKKKLLEGKTPIIVLLSGVFLLFFKLFEEVDFSREVFFLKKYSKGLLSSVSYYPQIHFIFILPVLLILLGLILRQKQRKNLKLSVKNNEKIIKVLCISISIVGLSFILFRFGVRLYELVMLMFKNNVNVKLPFYYYMLDIPMNYAISSDSYQKLVLLRFIKDLPIFLSSFISILMFIRIINYYVYGKVFSKEVKRRYRIIFILLIISSIIFNLLGLLEVWLFNSDFINQFHEAHYTIAIRSLTEPLFYGLFIYAFKHYVELAYSVNKSKK